MYDDDQKDEKKKHVIAQGPNLVDMIGELELNESGQDSGGESSDNREFEQTNYNAAVR